MSVANYSASITIRDNGLGIVDAGSDGVGCLIGTCSTGTAGTFYSYAGSGTNQAKDDLGRGPLADHTVKNLLRSGGKQTIAYKTTATTAGSSSAITRSGGAVGPLPTLSGAPYDYANAVLTIVTGGAVGTATFKYSLDGGDNYSQTLTTAASYLLDSNVTVTFTAGTYVAGETYSWTDTAPAFSTSDVSSAMDAVIDSIYDPEFVHVLGHASSAANSATMAATISTKVDAAWAAHKYFFAVMEAPMDTPENIISAFSSVEQKGLMVCGGFAEVINERSGEIEKKSSGRIIGPRIARNPIAIHLARDAADSDLDACDDVTALVPNGMAASTGYHDEDATPAYSAGRMSSLRTINGRDGFFVANGLTRAASTSDFQQVQYLRIVLKAARAWYKYALTQLAKRVRVDPNTGFIRSSFAKAIEDGGKAVILTALGDAIEGAKVIVNRADNITSDPTLRAKIRIAVGSYILTFDSDLGLTSNLTAAA